MVKDNQQIQSLRVSNLRKSYMLATHSLLTACSKEDFLRTVSSFKHNYQETLYQLYLQIIASTHENIQDQFESICQETQVMVALGTIEQLIENQKLDVLQEEKTSVHNVKQEVAKRKLNKIHYLKNMLEKVQEQNEMDKKCQELLQKSSDGLPNADTTLTKLKDYNLALQQVSQRMKSL